MTHKQQYILEIYFPNDDKSLLFRESSNSPFPRFVEGDIILTCGYKDQTKDSPNLHLAVNRIEYLLWESKDLESGNSSFTISTGVYTKELN